ncbi:MAG: anthranilate synthase component I family protein [Candidatus Delongbacteria bacterium]|nr:anthranilate synthase component I family protein [Candidatus Delongbacteria bacterium]
MKIGLNSHTQKISWNFELLFTLVEKYDGACLFTSAGDGSYGKNILGINPVLTFSDMLSLDIFLKENISDSEFPLVIGHIAYDHKDRLEEKGLFGNKHEELMPEVEFRVFEYYIIADNSDHSVLKTVKLDIPFKYKAVDPDKIFNHSPEKLKGGSSKYHGSSLTRFEFEENVEKIRDYILSGDIYQANLTRKISAETTFSPFELALRLKDSNSIEFGVYAKYGENFVISTSPERFFKIENSILTSSPIKGTAPRSDDAETDLYNLETLLSSKKELAELAMIVDLIRNDMNKICTEVKVEDFPIVMKLKNVYHLYSEISGRLRTASFFEIIRALFPGGSISGCPKIRACQIIEELEKTGRGLYTGNFGYISFNGNMDFNIMIRTLFYNKGSISFNAGGGITLLSDPESEFIETVHKAKNICSAIDLEEVWEEKSFLTE